MIQDSHLYTFQNQVKTSVLPMTLVVILLVVQVMVDMTLPTSQLVRLIQKLTLHLLELLLL